MRIAALSSIIGLILLGAGCETERQHTYVTPSGQVVSSGPSRASEDRALEQDLRSQLRQYGDLAADEPNIQIHASNGTVTMTGPVRSEREKAMIDAMVRSSSGVVAVNDELQVAYPPTGAVAPYPQPAPVYTTPPSPPAPVITETPARTISPEVYPNLRLIASTRSDESVANGIVSRLRDNNVRADWLEHVSITVSDGNAYVVGTVDNSEQERAIIASVQRVPGVRAV